MAKIGRKKPILNVKSSTKQTLFSNTQTYWLIGDIDYSLINFFFFLNNREFHIVTLQSLSNSTKLITLMGQSFIQIGSLCSWHANLSKLDHYVAGIPLNPVVALSLLIAASHFFTLKVVGWQIRPLGAGIWDSWKLVSKVVALCMSVLGLSTFLERQVFLLNHRFLQIIEHSYLSFGGSFSIIPIQRLRKSWVTIDHFLSGFLNHFLSQLGQWFFF